MKKQQRLDELVASLRACTLCPKMHRPAVSGGAVGYAVGRTVEQQRIAERDAVKVAEETLSGRAKIEDAKDSHSDDSDDAGIEFGT